MCSMREIAEASRPPMASTARQSHGKHAESESAPSLLALLLAVQIAVLLWTEKAPAVRGKRMANVRGWGQRVEEQQQEEGPV